MSCPNFIFALTKMGRKIQIDPTLSEAVPKESFHYKQSEESFHCQVRCFDLFRETHFVQHDIFDFLDNPKPMSNIPLEIFMKRQSGNHYYQIITNTASQLAPSPFTGKVGVGLTNNNYFFTLRIEPRWHPIGQCLKMGIRLDKRAYKMVLSSVMMSLWGKQELHSSPCRNNSLPGPWWVQKIYNHRRIDSWHSISGKSNTTT